MDLYDTLFLWGDELSFVNITNLIPILRLYGVFCLSTYYSSFIWI